MTETASHRETPREATEPLREDIRLLGGILGQIVREQAGDNVFDLVERARVESFRVRRSEIDRAELVSLFAEISTDDAIPVIRAFSHFALLANLAEDIHRERRRAIHVNAGEPPATALSPPRTPNSMQPISIRLPSKKRCGAPWSHPSSPLTRRRLDAARCSRRRVGSPS